MKALMALLTASLATLAFAVSPPGPSGPAAAAARAGPTKPMARPPLRVECSAPPSLRLHRFEDGSARLECAARTLVRISVAG